MFNKKVIAVVTMLGVSAAICGCSAKTPPAETTAAETVVETTAAESVAETVAETTEATQAETEGNVLDREDWPYFTIAVPERFDVSQASVGAYEESDGEAFQVFPSIGISSEDEEIVFSVWPKGDIADGIEYDKTINVNGTTFNILRDSEVTWAEDEEEGKKLEEAGYVKTADGEYKLAGNALVADFSYGDYDFSIDLTHLKGRVPDEEEAEFETMLQTIQFKDVAPAETADTTEE